MASALTTRGYLLVGISFSVTDFVWDHQMTPEASEKPSGAGLSLYANLLNTSSTSTSTPSTISRAPVVFKQAVGEDLRQDDVSAQKQQISAGRYINVPPALNKDNL